MEKNFSKNDIVLINHQGLKLSSGLQIQSPSPPIGLAYIGAYLKKNGYDYTAIDACGEALTAIRKAEPGSDLLVQGLTNKEVLEKIPSDVKIVGLTALFSHAWFLARDIAKEIKLKFPRCKIIFGGEHSSAQVKETLSHKFIDYVITGEGEETFLEFVNLYLNNKSVNEIQGLAYKSENGKIIENPKRKRTTEIDNFPYPDWDAWSIKEYINHLQVTGINLGRGIPILGSRGCPFECIFCSNKEMWGQRYIMRDPEKLVDEMDYMKKKYNVNSFHFMDSTFLINNKKLILFCKELIDRKLNISYQIPAGTRSECINEELVWLLDKSGLKNLALAPESGSEKIRRIVKKKINYKNFLKAARLLAKSNISVGCFVVIGFPEDNLKSMLATYRMIFKLAIIGVDDITVSQFTPYPGSYYYDVLLEKGLLKGRIEEMSDIISYYSQRTRSYSETLSPKSIYYFMMSMFIFFYVFSFILRPWKPILNVIQYFKTGSENARYVKFLSEIFIVRKKWFTNLVNSPPKR